MLFQFFNEGFFQDALARRNTGELAVHAVAFHRESIILADDGCPVSRIGSVKQRIKIRCIVFAEHDQYPFRSSQPYVGTGDTEGVRREKYPAVMYLNILKPQMSEFEGKDGFHSKSTCGNSTVHNAPSLCNTSKTR